MVSSFGTLALERSLRTAALEIQLSPFSLGTLVLEFLLWDFSFEISTLTLQLENFSWGTLSLEQLMNFSFGILALEL